MKRLLNKTLTVWERVGKILTPGEETEGKISAQYIEKYLYYL